MSSVLRRGYRKPRSMVLCVRKLHVRSAYSFCGGPSCAPSAAAHAEEMMNSTDHFPVKMAV